jgi:hypothetical protein
MESHLVFATLAIFGVASACGLLGLWAVIEYVIDEFRENRRDRAFRAPVDLRLQERRHALPHGKIGHVLDHPVRVFSGAMRPYIRHDR